MWPPVTETQSMSRLPDLLRQFRLFPGNALEVFGAVQGLEQCHETRVLVQ